MGGKQNNIATVSVQLIPHRRDFYRANKETGESAEQWMCRIKELAKSCSFGKYFDYFVLDKFLTGLEPEIIDHLCSSAECLDISNSLEIIHAYNTQKRDFKSIQCFDGQSVNSDDQDEPEVVFSQILVKCSDLPVNQIEAEDDDEKIGGDMLNGVCSLQNTSASDSESSQPKREENSSKKSPAKYNNKKKDKKFKDSIENDTNAPRTKRKYKKRATKEKQFYECEICHYKCVHQCHLKRHKLIHMNEKLFMCDTCGKRFNLFINLNAHIRRHEVGIRPFVCEICKASFMDRTRLKLHMRSHTGEKPFACTVCEKKFADRYYLKVHMRLHTGEKPFQCDQCDKSFSQSSSLSLHKRKNCFISQIKEKNCN